MTEDGPKSSSLPPAMRLDHPQRLGIHEQDLAMFVARNLFLGEAPAPRERRDVTEFAHPRVAVAGAKTHADGGAHVRVGAAREQQLA